MKWPLLHGYCVAKDLNMRNNDYMHLVPRKYFFEMLSRRNVFSVLPSSNFQPHTGVLVSPICKKNYDE